MKNPRQTLAVITGIVLALGWFVFIGSDRWNPGRVIFGIGMSIAGTLNLIRNPQTMTRMVIVIFFVPLLAAFIWIQARSPGAGWLLALIWSAVLLGLLFAHTWLHRPDREKDDLAENQRPNK